MGHQEAFPPPKLSGGCGFRKRPFAGDNQGTYGFGSGSLSNPDYRDQRRCDAEMHHGTAPIVEAPAPWLGSTEPLISPKYAEKKDPLLPPRVAVGFGQPPWSSWSHAS